MPKEYLHWIIADQARQSLPAGNLRSILDRNSSTLLLGAVSPDTPFHTMWGKGMKFLAKNREWAHGDGNPNTFGFISRLFQQNPPPLSAETEQIWTFAAGAACHICADTVLHPMVYHFCGSREKGSTARHFRFESVMDQLFMKSGRYSVHHQYRHHLKNSNAGDTVLTECANLVMYPENSLPAKTVASVFKKHSFIQGLYSKKVLRGGFKFLKSIGLPLGPYPNLFYPPVNWISRQDLRNGAVLDRQLTFRNPANGKIKTASLSDLVNEAVISTHAVWGQLARELAAPTGNAAIEGRHPGSGLPQGDKRADKLTDVNIKPVEQIFTVS